MQEAFGQLAQHSRVPTGHLRDSNEAQTGEDVCMPV